eukprot:scaffold1845_cov178-Ochromonas_danica.AAC.2
MLCTFALKQVNLAVEVGARFRDPFGSVECKAFVLALECWGECWRESAVAVPYTYTVSECHSLCCPGVVALVLSATIT